MANAIKLVVLLLVITLAGYLANRDMEKQATSGNPPSSSTIKRAWFVAVIGGSVLVYFLF